MPKDFFFMFKMMWSQLSFPLCFPMVPAFPWWAEGAGLTLSSSLFHSQTCPKLRVCLLSLGSCPRNLGAGIHISYVCVYRNALGERSPELDSLCSHEEATKNGSLRFLTLNFYKQSSLFSSWGQEIHFLFQKLQNVVVVVVLTIKLCQMSGTINKSINLWLRNI